MFLPVFALTLETISLSHHISLPESIPPELWETSAGLHINRASVLPPGGSAGLLHGGKHI